MIFFWFFSFNNEIIILLVVFLFVILLLIFFLSQKFFQWLSKYLKDALWERKLLFKSSNLNRKKYSESKQFLLNTSIFTWSTPLITFHYHWEDNAKRTGFFSEKLTVLWYWHILDCKHLYYRRKWKLAGLDP